jgi:hypothetical protein
MEMLNMICGWTSYENMVVATTMWPDRSAAISNGALRVDSQTALETREVELITDERFLGDVVDKGAAVFRHNETGAQDISSQTLSARRIVSISSRKQTLRHTNTNRFASSAKSSTSKRRWASLSQAPPLQRIWIELEETTNDSYANWKLG